MCPCVHLEAYVSLCVHSDPYASIGTCRSIRISFVSIQTHMRQFCPLSCSRMCIIISIRREKHTSSNPRTSARRSYGETVTCASPVGIDRSLWKSSCCITSLRSSAPPRAPYISTHA